MKILGLDTSTTSTGYAVLDNDKLVSYGCIKTPKNIDLLDKYIYIEKRVKDILKAKQIEVIIIEDLAVTRSASTTKALAGLLYHLLVEFRKRELLTVTVRPSQWRKVCNIKGKSRKELKENAITYVKNVYNISVNDDEADAICIAEYSKSLEIEEENYD